ncbi:hypothetical protein [Paracoccus binzhouensis]|uniref:hypothetical protein n=1 Tax=Paracoccus binzhouensis TaxID=2796149 RepID=UPI0018EF2F31|nr:hypothetical protein [Paracoccus binzhouensis]
MRGKVIPFDPPAEATAIHHGKRGRNHIGIDGKPARAGLEKSLAVTLSRRFSGMPVNLLTRSGDHEALIAWDVV